MSEQSASVTRGWTNKDHTHIRYFSFLQPVVDPLDRIMTLFWAETDSLPMQEIRFQRCPLGVLIDARGKISTPSYRPRFPSGVPWKPRSHTELTSTERCWWLHHHLYRWCFYDVLEEHVMMTSSWHDPHLGKPLFTPYLDTFTNCSVWNPEQSSSNICHGTVANVCDLTSQCRLTCAWCFSISHSTMEDHTATNPAMLPSSGRKVKCMYIYS